MARQISQERMKWWWLTSINSITAPLVTDLTAGTDITPFFPVDGAKFPTTNNAAKNDDISTAYMAELPGSYSVKGSINFFRDDVTDTAFTLWGVRNTSGFIVIRRMVPYSTAAAAGQKVDVYAATTGQIAPDDPAADSRQMAMATFFITAKPTVNVALA